MSATQLNATASVPGTITYSPGNGTTLAAGVQTLTANFNPTDGNYTTATSNVTLTVNQAIPVITWANPTSPITYGTALSATQLNATASVNGTITYSPGNGTTLDAGIQTLTANFTPFDSGNYTNATASKNLTVNKATPTISVSPSSQTERSGKTYPITITTTPANFTISLVSSNTGTARISNSTLTTNATTGMVTANVTVVGSSGSCNIVISPNDTVNYNSLNVTHTVTAIPGVVTANQTFNGTVGVTSQYTVLGAATNYVWTSNNSTGNLTFSNSTGNLTLAITSNGVISCTPINAGNFTANVRGSLGNETSTANLTFYIAKGDQIITGVSPIQTKVQGATYTINPLIVRNGNITSSSSNFTSSNYTTANLSALNGTSTTVNATATGSANITISQNATVDYNSANCTQSLTIIDRPSVTSQIFNGTINIPFSALISGNNTNSATTFATTSNLTGNRTNGLGVNGTLTTIGLTLNPLTGAITGTPTLAGNFSINATATRDGVPGTAGNLTFRISPMIAGWDFQTTKKSPVPFIQAVMSPSTYAANFGSANGTMYFNGLNGSSRWVYSNGTIFVGSGANSTNAADGFSEVFGSPAALKLVSSSSSQNASIVFSSDSTAGKTYTLSYAYVNTAGGFAKHTLEWTHNSSNATWTSLGNRTFPKLANATYTTANFSTSNFTSATANATGTIFFRLTLSNGNTTVTASPNSPNFTIIDNVQIGMDSANAIAVAPPLVNPQTFSGTNGTTNYRATIIASNSPQSYSITSGNLTQRGLSLDFSTGVISGNLTQAGNFTITVNATNSGGTGSGNLTFNILDSLLTVNPATFSAQRRVLISSTNLSYRVTATGSPLGYSISGGSFPPGLFLNPSNGQISGTPTTKGTFIFYVKARNAAGLSNAAKITFTVN